MRFLDTVYIDPSTVKVECEYGFAPADRAAAGGHFA